MSVAAFDTRALIKELTTGKGAVSKETAEKIVDVVQQAQILSRDDLATKSDLIVLKSELQIELAKLRADLTIKMFGGQLATVLLILGAFKYFTH